MLKKFYPKDEFIIDLRSDEKSDQVGLTEKKDDPKKVKGFSLIIRDKNMRQSLFCLSLIWTVTSCLFNSLVFLMGRLEGHVINFIYQLNSFFLTFFNLITGDIFWNMYFFAFLDIFIFTACLRVINTLSTFVP